MNRGGTQRFFILIGLILLLVSCTKQEVAKPAPVDFDREDSCHVCGMIMVDFPGSKVQIHYTNGRIDKFCSTIDFFIFYLQPDRPVNISAIYLNDMGKADWNQPEGHWIDAEDAFYVYGGDVMGPMGEALVPFSDIKDAESYTREHGGKIVRFNEVNMEMLMPDMHHKS